MGVGGLLNGCRRSKYAKNAAPKKTIVCQNNRLLSGNESGFVWFVQVGASKSLQRAS
jgi:hypothetical protein